MLNGREIKVIKFLCYSCSNNIKYISLTYELFLNKSSNIFSKKLCSHILSLTLIKNWLTTTSSCLSSFRFLLTSTYIKSFILRCLVIWIIWICNVCICLFTLSFSIWLILNILSSSFFCLCSNWRWWWRRRRLSIIIYLNWRRWWRWRLSIIYFNWRRWWRWRLSIIIYLNWRWWRWRLSIIIIYLNWRWWRWR